MNRLRLLAIALPVVLALLAGCGVGVGGTGTGESGDVLADFGAAPLALCDAPFASQLDCEPRAEPGQPSPSTGTLDVFYVDAPTGRQVVAQFAGNGITLDVPCLRVRFVGTWGAPPGGEAAFLGIAQAGDDPTPVLARLRVTPLPGNGELEVELRFADGRPLLGPQQLRRAAAPVAPGCS